MTSKKNKGNGKRGFGARGFIVRSQDYFRDGGFAMGQPVVHFEIGCRDKVATSTFYAEAFGWTIDPGMMGTIDTGSKEGIQGHIASLGHEPHQFIHFYVQVEDVGAAFAKIEALGGKRLVGPVDLPNGSFGWFEDVGGNRVGLWKPV